MTAKGAPTWLKSILILEAMIAFSFLIWGWSHTSSMTFGRSPPLIDILALALPLILVVLAAVGAVRLAQGGRPGIALALALLPFPLALFLAGFFGAI